jgi:cell division septum initiation protein DivIVA
MSPAGNSRDFSKQQRALRTTTAERLEAIVEAAERAAEGVIDDAEAQARRYLAQAKAEADRLAEGRNNELSDLIETLLGQALSLRREAEALQATLEEARGRIEGGAEATDFEPPPVEAEFEEPEAPEAPTAPRLRAVASEEAPASVGGAGQRSDAAGARLLATQMAISGSSREEIAHRLRSGFEIEDADAILDAILGREEA